MAMRPVRHPLNPDAGPLGLLVAVAILAAVIAWNLAWVPAIVWLWTLWGWASTWVVLTLALLHVLGKLYDTLGR